MAFQQGLSGLNAMSKALDAVGNNVANASTVGFKSSSAHFADLYAASLSGSGSSATSGIGTSVAAVAQQFTQGNITSTNNTLDLAINGSGFYKTISESGEITYTRNGQFTTDKEGYVINDQGNRLMGYAVTATGTVVPSTPVAIQLDKSNMAPQATGTSKDASVKLNLNSGSDVPTVTTFDADNPLSYTYSTAMTVYDTLGNDHSLTMYFVKNTATGGDWNVYATMDGDADTAIQLGTLQFDTSGTLTASTDASGTATTELGIFELPRDATNTDPTTPPVTGWDPGTGAASPMGTGLSNWNLDFNGTTSYGGTSTVNSTTQDGYAQGALTSYSVSDEGVILGNYSNGQAKTMAQVVLTVFPNANGLANLGNNQWAVTSASGQGLDGTPGSGARGVLQSSAVEESNVDLTTELVNMITLQRNYQANSQTIKTQDEIMQTIVNLR